MKQFFTRLTVAFMLLAGFSQAAFAEANYVYHEQTTNNPGCGADNYMSTTTPTNAAGVTIAWKVEYQFYTDNVRLYYTTDGSTPSGSLGVGSGTTQVVTGSYSCTFGGPVVDVATATIPAQLPGTTVKYIVSAWHSSDNVEIFANGPGSPCSCGTPTNSSSLATVFSYTVAPSANVVVYSAGGTGAPFTGYTTLAAAITAINGGTAHTGTTTVYVTNGYAETAPAGGYLITASGASGSPITIRKSSSTGANPILTAPTTHTVGSLTDAIFKISGGDYIAIDGFTMLENAANLITTAASNNMTEFGVVLFYATTTNGCQNITIQNNTITLNRTYQNTWGVYANSTHSSTSITTTASATTTAGANNNLKIYGNTISNVNQGICVVGPTAAADMNTGLDIGGTGGAQANSITNWGTTGTFSGYVNVSGTLNCILVRNSTGFNVSYNTLTSSVGGNTVTTSQRAVYVPSFSVAPTGTFTNTINNNNISVQSGFATGTLNGIINETTTGTATSSLTISNNNFNTWGHTVAASGAATFINNTMAHLNLTINSNTYTNITLGTTGSVTFISASYSAPTGGSKTINSNSIVTAFNKTGAGGTVTLYTDNGSSVAGVIVNNNNNNFSNITVTGATTIAGWSNTDGGSPTKTVQGNTFSNWTGGTNSITALNLNFGSSPSVTSASQNTISNITGGGSVTGINIGSSVSSCTLTQNTINTLSSTGTSATVSAISSSSTTANITKNKIYDISGNQTGTLVNGINVVSGTTININNNLIGDLRATAATGLNAINGINASATSTYNVYYNSIYLNATSSSVTTFGSSCITFSSTATTLDLRNNILVNSSTPAQEGLNVATNGVSAALRRSSGTTGTVPANYNTNSNTNLYWANPTAGTNNHLTYVEGTSTITNPKNTVADMKAFMLTRDQLSVQENPTFASTTGSSSTFLHFAAATSTLAESGAANIAGITDDYDANTRQGNVGYTGTGTAPDIGADEFEGTNPSIVTTDAGATALATPLATGCYTNAETVTITVKNYGTAMLDFSVNPLSITVNVTGAATATLNGSVSTGTLASGASANYTVTPTLNMSAAGTYTFNASASVTGDGNATNDAMSAANRTVTASVSLPQTVDFTGFTGSNLTSVFPNWYEAIGASTPSGTTSGWTSSTLIAGSGTTAKINLFTTTKVDWIVGPKFLADANTILEYKVAITDFASASADPSGMAGTDDKVVVKISTDCGASYADLFTYNSSNTGSITNSLVAQSISLASYAGQQCIIAFYAQDGPIDDAPDYDFHIDDINISAPANCTGTPDAGTASITAGPVCALTSVTASTSGATSGIGISYQWQSSPDGSSFNDIIGATATSYNTSSLTSTTYFRMIVTCSFSSLSDTSNVVSVTITPNPTGNTFADPIIISSLPYSTTGDNLAANCWTSAYTGANAQASPDVFYKYVAACNGTLQIDVCPPTLDSYIHLLDGTGTQITFNDDTEPVGCTNTAGSSITYTSMVAGSTYYIVVEGFSTNTGTYNLSITETPTLTTFYTDSDGDGYGNISSPVTSCNGVAPSGSVGNSLDCNDANAAVNPAATEVCNTIDDDCDGLTDDADPGITGQSTWYTDLDGDGFGDETDPGTLACFQPANTSADNTDCDDTNAAVNPGATEVCNGIDDDCDGLTDEGVLITFYADTDGDSYGDAGSTTLACSAPSGYVSNDDDCDDTNAAINPAASEICNGIDDDCDGLTDSADPSITGEPTWYADADGDGYGDASTSATQCTAPFGYVSNDDDCDDTNASVNPGATEICNGIDDDCDGFVDEGVQTTFYADTDGDGYGDAGSTTLACTAPSGYVSNDDDCDDTNAAVNPGATEICNGIDDDCDGLVDDADPGITGQPTWYADTDGDGYGDAGSTTLACTAPSGYVSNDDDCDDTNAAVNPGATEVCNLIDDDCDGFIDEGVQTTFYADTDGDGYGDAGSTTLACSAPSGYVSNDDDCDDTNAAVNPAATEVCNLIDDDCDGFVDEGVQTTFYADTDGDGYGDAGQTTLACSAPSGYVSNDDDCDDTNASVNPGATEVCNGIDDDCDGFVDEGVQTTFYADTDGDGYGDAGSTTLACSAPSGYVSDNTDCDDTNAAVNPGATEVCNLIDDDCDGLTDEGVQTTFYADTDGDGYGDAGSTTLACSAPSGYVSDNTDCDDTNAAVNPGATEVCNLIDDDCDGFIDEGVQTTFFADADGDGYGDAGSTTLACSAPSGYVSDNTDCDDTNASVNPGATEVCNGIDDDCDGFIDEGLTYTTYYADADGDGYGDAGSTTSTCTGSAPSGYVSDNTDCDDTNAAINPGATEVCNGIDDDCDGLTDEGVQTTFFADADGDGYGDAGSTTLACSAPSGYVSDNTDCDDTNAAVNPGATEVCNGIDDDCDGFIDEGLTYTTYYADADGDGYGDAGSTTSTCTGSAPSGYVSDNTDCDDTNAAINPGATEVCNGIDDDCDGFIDEGVQTTFYADADGDGYGDAGSTTLACSAPSGYVSNDDDCDDTNAAVNPGATEVCNGIDDDCDGFIDEGLTFTTYYADADGDGYGDAGSTTSTCTGSAPSGYVSDNTDCDDTNAAVNPGATEVCNGIDDDCDGFIDEGVQTTFYADADGDGYGDAGSTTLACSAPSGYVSNDDDCDDTNAAVNPGATEVCNGIDDDCDGFVDEGVQTTFYADADGDGYGDAGSTTLACSAPSGYVSDNTDCDDTNAAINPGATEVCNGIDDDCDGFVDEGLTYTTYYADADGDGYGDAGSTTTTCTGSAPSGYVSDNTDCDDTNAAVNPGATEVCNGIDDDCNGLTDEGVISATITPLGPTTFCKGTDNVVLQANTGVGYGYIWRRNGSNIPGATSSSYTATKSGNYTVFITIPGGCFNESAPVTVTTLASPAAIINNLSGFTDLCFSPSIKLKANGGGGVTYLWLKNGLSTGVTTVTINVTTPGLYQVVVTKTSTGCQKTSLAVNIIETCREGEGVAEKATINVYPNPTASEFIVDMTIPGIAEGTADLYVLNMLGEQVMFMNGTVNNNRLTETLTFDNNATGGVYLVKVMVDGVMYTSQIVLTK